MTYDQLQKTETVLSRLHLQALRRKDGLAASRYGDALKEISKEYQRVIRSENIANNSVIKLLGEL